MHQYFDSNALKGTREVYQLYIKTKHSLGRHTLGMISCLNVCLVDLFLGQLNKGREHMELNHKDKDKGRQVVVRSTKT